MNKKFLGYPNQSIINWLKRTPPTPVVRKLKMTATNGTVCEFDYEDIPQPLKYLNSSRVVQKPFLLCSDISDFNTIVRIDDQKENILSVGNNSFRECSCLTSVNMPNSEFIDYYAFYKCIELKNININNVYTIGNFAFYACSSLYYVDIQNAETIGTNTFQYCYNLSDVNCQNIKTIEKAAFSSCSNLSSINFPNILSIGQSTFQGCSNLLSINCPNTLSIGQNTFIGCTKLSTVILSNMLEDKITILGSTTAFGNKRKWPISVYVPEELTSTLYGMNNWQYLIELSTIELVGV